MDTEVLFMEKVYLIKEDKRNVIPAVTHNDGTGRLQTVRKKTNPRYYNLIKEFMKIKGVPVDFINSEELRVKNSI